MKEIPLTQGKVTFVDDDDFDRLSKHKWSAVKHIRQNRTLWYAVRGVTVSVGKLKAVWMHREILRSSSNIDHKDGDGLNNQKHNIRPCTDAQNQQNAFKRIGCSSKYKGVCWFARYGKWQAIIHPNKSKVFLGYFVNEDDAGMAYNSAAIKYYGEFARLNEIQ